MSTYPTASRRVASNARRPPAPLAVWFVDPPVELSEPSELPDGRMLLARSPVKLLPLAEGTTCFGRSATCGVRFPDAATSTTSRQHAEVRRKGDRYFLRDIDSKHGTWRNGMQLRGSEQEIVHGDVVRFGEWVGVVVQATSGQDGALQWDLGRGFVGGPALWAALAPARACAGSAEPVIIEGETGTGKELLARWIHRMSRRVGPWVGRNCAALPESLVEGELFGWKRGAFTGADRDRDGCFQLAHRGSLLLDEVDCLDSTLQAKLLRVVQEGELVRLGAAAGERVDVRVLASTQKCLALEQREGRFRPDLYYRLATHVVTLPPLRERREDIAFLFRRFFASDVAHREGLPMQAEFVERLCLDDWPGNVRELKSFAERVRCGTEPGSVLTVAEFEAHRLAARPAQALKDPTMSPHRVAPSRASVTLESRRPYVLAIASRGGNLAALAREFDVSKDTLYRFLNRSAPGWRLGRDRARRRVESEPFGGGER